MRIAFALFAAWIALASPCIAQPQLTGYKALIEQDLRLATIGYRLALGNAPFCKTLSKDLGWVLHDRAQYPDPKLADAAFAFRQPVSVAAMVAGGPADTAGIAVGDGLVGLNGAEWEWRAPAAKANADRLHVALDNLDIGLANGSPASLTLQTAQGKRTFVVNPPPVCASRFWVDVRDGKDAGADGKRVRITSGLMAYAANDDEMAAVVAHELAHNILGHRARLDSTKRGKGKAVLATEIEADRLSVWMMANAGYDVQAALRFAERFGRQYGLGIFSDGTHQRWKRRVAVMQAEIDLIARTPKVDGKLSPPLLAQN